MTLCTIGDLARLETVLVEQGADSSCDVLHILRLHARVNQAQHELGLGEEHPADLDALALLLGEGLLDILRGERHLEPTRNGRFPPPSVDGAAIQSQPDGRLDEADLRIELECSRLDEVRRLLEAPNLVT